MFCERRSTPSRLRIRQWRGGIACYEISIVAIEKETHKESQN
jgi:hypothetical protein